MDKRYLVLDIYDYSGNRIVNLYDSSKQMSGEAIDIVKIEERNGWKELSFTLPSTCSGENGEEENYRLQYLVADYMIRFMDGKETDWYIISEPKVTHDHFSKNINVTAGHIAQLLKTKKLSLEFSDTEGNNVGTAKELLECVLDGTDWHVGNVGILGSDGKYHDFVENYDSSLIKRRTLTAGTETGAFKLVEMICELFDAKPVYHGEGQYLQDNEYHTGQVIDIVPMNPFSKSSFGDAGIPKDVLEGNNKVLELHYSRNLKNMSRTLNTENMVTKLYAYGSYGDMNGLCSIQTCEHNEYYYTVTRAIPKNTELRFYESVDEFTDIAHYFTTSNALRVGAKLVWSQLDFSSRAYVWDDTNKYAYKVYSVPQSSSHRELQDDSTLEIKTVQNLFPYLMNFDYYNEVGLLTDDKLQKIARFQRETPDLYETAIAAATNFAQRLADISELGNPNTGYLRFASSGYIVNNDKSTDVTINTSLGDSGVLYRSDYINSRRNQFIWHVAKELDSTGDPITGTPSYVLVAHENYHSENETDVPDPITWEKSYVKEIWVTDKNHSDPYLLVGSDGLPGDFVPATMDESVTPVRLVLWAPMQVDNRIRSMQPYKQTDQFFLFCTNSQSGQICGIEIQTEEIVHAQIQTCLGSELETHPVYFMDARPEVEDPVANVPPLSVVSLPNQFGWYYKYYVLERRFGDLFFCGPTDREWHPVTVGTDKNIVSNATPNGSYFFDTNTRVLSARIQGKWVDLESSQDKRIASCFTTVIMRCYTYDEMYKGVYDYYYHEVDGNETGKYLTALPVGRYLIDSGYDYYWAFTTTQTIPKNSTLKVDTQNGYVYQDDDIGHILKVVTVNKDQTIRMLANDLYFDAFSEGFLDDEDGLERNANEFTKSYTPYKSKYINVYPGEKYYLEMPEAVKDKNKYIGGVFFYDANKQYIDSMMISDSNTLTKDGGYFIVPKSTGINPEEEDYHPDAELIRIMWTSNNSFLGFCKMTMENYDKKIYQKDNTHTCYTLLSTTDYGKNLLGLNNLMARFVNASNDAYLNVLAELQDAQDRIKELETDMTESLGPMLREGYWRDDSYVSGDEVKLYHDAMDNLEEIGKPEASYSISFIDQYGSNQNMGYSIDGSTDLIPYVDIDISNAVHLVDHDIGVNCWAYLDKVKVCYDKTWETEIEINTRLSLIGQHDFTDVLSSIAEVAKTSKARQVMYDMSAEMNGIDLSGQDVQQSVGQTTYNGETTYNATIDGVDIFNHNYFGINSEELNYGGDKINESSAGAVTLDGRPVNAAIIHGANVSGVILTGVDFAGAISTGLVTENKIAERVREELEKMIAAEDIKFANTRSNWYTDEATGDLVFAETRNGNPTGRALKIGGRGMFRAFKFDQNGEYEWRTVLTYDGGINADNITSGRLRSALIESATIAADQLTSDVGQVLDISSNKGLDLYATRDGTKPSGALKTTDAIIEIHGKLPEAGIEVAQINLKTGGEINLEAGPEVVSYSKVNDFPDEGQTDVIYYAEKEDKYYIWDKDALSYTESAKVGGINILAGREINIGSKGKLSLKSEGVMDIEGGAGLNVASGGAINIQSGAKQGVSGELNILSTGNMNILANGALRIAAGVDRRFLETYYYMNDNGQYVIFQPSFDSRTGLPVNVVYRSDGTAYGIISGKNYQLFTQQGDKKSGLVSGKIIVESTNGIDIQSGGSINIASGANGGIAGDLNISSTGKLNIEAGGKLTLRSNSSPYPGGELIIESGGHLSLASGSTMDIGVGSSVDNLTAKLNINSTGEINISANGKLNLLSTINPQTNITEHRYEWKRVPASGTAIITAGFGSSTSSKSAAYQAALTQIQNQVKTWLNSHKTQTVQASEALAEAESSLSYYFMVGTKRYDGGKIRIESDNGIDIGAGGSIRIGSGATQTVKGNIDILSSGKLNIGAGGEILISAGTTNVEGLNPTPGKITIASTGLINIAAGGALNLVGGTLHLEGGIFSVKSGNFAIDSAGNVSMRGKINALAGGTVGGWNIGNKDLYIEKTIETGSFPANENLKVSLNTDVTRRTGKVISISTSATQGGTSEWFSITAHGEVRSLSTTTQTLNATGNVDFSTDNSITLGRFSQTTQIYPFQYIADKLYIGNFHYNFNYSSSSPKYTSMVGRQEVQLSGQSTITTFAATFNTPSTSTSASNSLTLSTNLILGIGNDADITMRNFKVTRFGTLYAGDAIIVGTLSAPSSIEVKHDINSLTYQEDIFDKLIPVSFKYNKDDTNKTHYGLIYEDAINLIPDVCQEYNGNKSINYVELVPMLIKEIQNLRKRISDLEKG